VHEYSLVCIFIHHCVFVNSSQPGGIPLAYVLDMSRVERRENNEQWRGGERRREPIGRTPSKAEGDEETVDQALQNQEGRQSESGKREEPR
jgi:hypothetical protein